jgi:hypothetical protein
VRDCKTEMPNTSRYEYLVKGIKSGLQSFRSVNIAYVKEEANMIAHSLARDSRSCHLCYGQNLNEKNSFINL